MSSGPDLPTVLVDARNVIRSTWPNMPETELVEACRRWSAAAGARAVLVFDGTAPRGSEDDRLALVGTGRESADDWIARAANELARAGRAYRLVTSDRGLRARAAHSADEVVGGGTFLRTLRGATARSAG